MDGQPKNDPQYAANHDETIIEKKTERLEMPFQPRQPGAVFADRFTVESVTTILDQEIDYVVTAIPGTPAELFACAECGTPYTRPADMEPPPYCERCGHNLSYANPLRLRLIEVDDERRLGKLPQLATLVGETPIVTPFAVLPTFSGTEQIGSAVHHFVVMPLVGHARQGQVIDRDAALVYGRGLADGLHQLHTLHEALYQDGVQVYLPESFSMPQYESMIAFTDGRAIWADLRAVHMLGDFNTVPADQPGSVHMRLVTSNIQSLTSLVMYWLTGHSNFSTIAPGQTGLSPVIERLLHDGLNPAQAEPPIATAADLRDRFDAAIGTLASMRAYTHVVGKLTDVGVVRQLNEDSIASFEQLLVNQSKPRPAGVFVIADGMGGHAAGELASGMIIEHMATQVQQSFIGVALTADGSATMQDWLRHAVETANQAVYQRARDMGTDMGSTLVMATVIGNEVSVAHVGDSRAYRFDAQGQLHKLTADHSLVERMVEMGQLTDEEARTHPQSNVIYRTMGDKAKVDVDTASFSFKPGDKLVLCSDGLNGMLPDSEIARLLAAHPAPQTACEHLVAAAREAGGTDNISVIIVQILESTIA